MKLNKYIIWTYIVKQFPTKNNVNQQVVIQELAHFSKPLHGTSGSSIHAGNISLQLLESGDLVSLQPQPAHCFFLHGHDFTVALLGAVQMAVFWNGIQLKVKVL